MKCFVTTTFALIVASLGGVALHASESESNTRPESSAAPLSDLQQAIQKAKDQFQPIPSREVVLAKKRLQRSLRGLDRLLATTNKEYRDGWKKYLRWEELRQQLRADSPDLQVLRSIHSRYRQNHNGLEMTQFAAVRHALSDFNNLLTYTTHSDLRTLHTQLLNRLGELVTEEQKAPSISNTMTMGRILGTLEDARQSSELIKMIRQQYAHPNMQVSVSSEFVARNLSAKVEDDTSISESLLGTHQTGEAHTVGTIGSVLVPNNKKANLLITLKGETATRTVGRRPIGLNGQITIYSQGTTEIDARKHVLIDATGVHTCPAEACCDTHTHITGICTPPLIGRLVESQVYRKKPQAEAIASDRAERRIEKRFNQRVEEALAEARQNYQEKIRRPLLRMDSFPEKVNLSSTENAVNVHVRSASPYQLGSPVAPLEPVSADVSLSVHESAIVNLFETLLGGQTLTDEKAAELAMELTGEVPEDLKISQDKDPWSITFPQAKPVLVQFGDNQVTIKVRGRRFTRGSTRISREMEISATFKVEKVGTGSKFTRMGEVTAEYTRGGRLSASQIAIRTFVQQKFASLFKEEFESKGLQPQGRFKDRRPLHLKMFEMKNGWVQIAWNQAKS